MGLASVVVLFGLTCPEPCPAAAQALEALELTVTAALESQGLAVRPPAPGAARPTGESASPEAVDVARRLGVDRVLALDLEPGGKLLWLTHFVRGAAGAWSVGRLPCLAAGPRLECPGIERAVVNGLRPRTAADVDFVAALRAGAHAVDRCVQEEDRVPAADRIYGRLELYLEAQPSGEVKVLAIAPTPVAKARLGGCLRLAMEALEVGPFEGKPVRLRVPVDL